MVQGLPGISELSISVHEQKIEDALNETDREFVE